MVLSMLVILCFAKCTHYVILPVHWIQVDMRFTVTIFTVGYLRNLHVKEPLWFLYCLEAVQKFFISWSRYLAWNYLCLPKLHKPTRFLRVKPYIKELVLEVLSRESNSPFNLQNSSFMTSLVLQQVSQKERFIIDLSRFNMFISSARF